jgi:hypothetical protein
MGPRRDVDSTALASESRKMVIDRLIGSDDADVRLDAARRCEESINVPGWRRFQVLYL